MQRNNNDISFIAPYSTSKTIAFNLPGWAPNPGFTLVKHAQSEHYCLIDTRNNVAVYTVILHPYCGVIVGNKLGVLVDIKQTPKPGYHEVIRQFPYALFFTHLLSKYTLILTGKQQSVDSHRFWFRRISWAYAEGYHLYISNDNVKDPLFKQLPDWTVFFNAWLDFCHDNLTGQSSNIMIITTENE